MSGLPPPPADAGALEAWGERALARLADFLEESRAGSGGAIRLRPREEIDAELDFAGWIRRGGMDAAGFDAWLDRYLAGCTRLHHPGYLAHQVAAPDPASAVADLIHGVVDNPMAIREMGPTAAAAEMAILDWMLEKVGWPGGAGVLTHGGSLANLTALLAARAAAAPGAWEEGVTPDLALFAPPGAHYSVARAASIMGLGARSVLPLPVDEREVVRPEGVAEAIDAARAGGRRPIAVVVGACATATGLHDPIRPIAEVCRDRGVWLHVDGAHGASALLSPRLRDRLDGIERADSLVWDAHKMLRTSTVCAAVLFRDAEAAAETFHERASYLFYEGEGVVPGVDLMRRAVECTKAALGTRLFLVLARVGEAGLARHVEARYDAARRFEERIRARPGFETLGPPESNMVCFRRVGSDPLQLAIREALIRDGRWYLSSAEVAGRRWLRMVVMNEATDEATIGDLLDAIDRIAGEMDAGEGEA